MRFKAPFLILFLIILIQNSTWANSPFTFKLSSPVAKQGDTLRLDVYSSEKIIKNSVRMNGKSHYLLPKPDSTKAKYQYFVYLGISREMQPQKYAIRTQFTTKKGSKFIKTMQVTIKSGNFKKSIVNLSPKKHKLNQNRAQLAKESRLIGQKFRSQTRTALFFKPFIKPAKGTYTTHFGAFRVYNKVPLRKHSGVDIANIEKTPILAANSGKIILSTPFKSHGETVMIDHGLGVVSIYNHLSKRLVSKGQWVNRGNKIGLMGETGIATGPHLHWGLSVHNVRVNPLFWLDNPSLYE